MPAACPAERGTAGIYGHLRDAGKAADLARLAAGGVTSAAAGSPDWLRLARLLSWVTLGWLGVEAGVAIAAAITAGSVALLGFGLDSGIEALASVIVIWRFTGTRLTGATAERRAQQLVAVSFWLLAPYVAAEAILGLARGDRPETTVVGPVRRSVPCPGPRCTGAAPGPDGDQRGQGRPEARGCTGCLPWWNAP